MSTATKVPLTDSEILAKLAQNPAHAERFMTLERAARDALKDGLDTGTIRRDFDTYQVAMQRVYGRVLTFKDVTAGILLCSSRRLHKQMSSLAAELQEAAEVAPEEASEITPTTMRV